MVTSKPSVSSFQTFPFFELIRGRCDNDKEIGENHTIEYILGRFCDIAGYSLSVASARLISVMFLTDRALSTKDNAAKHAGYYT